VPPASPRGIFLLIGAYTRVVAFILAGDMAAAYFIARFPRSLFPVVNGGDAAVLFCFTFFYIFFAGGGPWSLDRAVLKQDESAGPPGEPQIR
jgi:putative oxidoreductase